MADIFDSYLINLNVVCAVFTTDFVESESLPAVIDSSFPSKEIKELKTTFDSASLVEQQKIGGLVLEQPNLIKALWDFSLKVYKNLGKGVPRALGLSLLNVRDILIGWCEVNHDISRYLFDINLVQHLALELTELKNVPEIDQYTKCLIIIDLTLEQCLAQSVSDSISVFHAISFVDILRPFLMSSEDQIKTMSKITLSYLGQSLREDEIILFELDEKEVTCFCEGLANAVTSVDFSCQLFGIRFSVLELLEIIHLLLASLKNQDKFLKEDVNILDFIGIILTSMEDNEKQAAIKILWALFRNPLAQKSIIMSKKFLIGTLQTLKFDSTEEVALMSSCVLYTAGLEERKDISLLLSLAEIHYKYKIFDKCIDICNYVDKNVPKRSTENNTARLVKAKALFLSYQNEKRNLESCNTMSTKEYYTQHASCYKKASEVIVLLGIALDQNFIDEEGSCFLDYAMMDHLQNVNSKDRQRCLLCRKKARLHRSHTWPNAILSAFTSGLRTDDTRKVFDGDTVGVLKSASMITSWMLCTTCEEMISGNAETQFLQGFFHKIYDTKSPNKVKEEQLIDYEEWLYYFCVSIIFRGLAGLSIYSNCSRDRLYWLYKQCRRFLLQSCVKNIDESTKMAPPDVYVIIGPTKPSEDDEVTGFINQAIHSPGLCAISPFSLSDGSRSSLSHCLAFIAHCGVINIVVDLAPLSEFELSCHAAGVDIAAVFKIDCQIGKYKVPSDNARAELMPPGVSKFLHVYAELLEGRWLTRQSKYASKILNKSFTSPPSQKADTFMVIEAVNTDLESVSSYVKPSIDVSNPKVVNLLPRQFRVNKKEHAPSSIQLPQGHVLLIHKHYEYGDGVSETLFLAVGTEGEYSLFKPYVLFFRFIPGLYFYTGFFISPDDYTAQEFLPDDDPKFLTDKVTQIINARSIIHKVIPELMKDKGFHSYYSCLHRLHGKRPTEFPTLDLKCSEATGRCWYCHDLCELCFKPAIVGITAYAHNKTTLLKFCSQNCKNNMFPPRPLNNWSPLVVISKSFLDFGDNDTVLQSPGHKELFRVHAYKPASDISIMINFSLCIANGSDCFPARRPYVMYHLRSTFLQLYLEFFIDSSLVPEVPVPYYTTRASMSEVIKMKGDTTFKAMLKGSLQSQGFVELDSLLQLAGEF